MNHRSSAERRRDDVKTTEFSLLWDKFGGYLLTDQMASGIEVA